MTKEQYSGVIPRSLNMFSASRDSLNPLLNTERLKQRLDAIEYYKYKHGQVYSRWPHYALGKAGRHLMRYKFNYAVKGFAAYLLYSDYQQYKHLSSIAIMSLESDAEFIVRITGKTVGFAALCMLI